MSFVARRAAVFTRYAVVASSTFRARPFTFTAAAAGVSVGASSSFSTAAPSSSFTVFNENDMKLDDLTKDSKALLYYTASWCGPCKMIAPHFAKLAEKHGKSIRFVKIDVDDNENTAAKAAVSSIPTFHVLSGGKKVKSFLGANVDQLNQAVEALAAE